MAKSKVVITFNYASDEGEYLSFINSLSATELSEVFVALRSGPFQASLGSDEYSSSYNYMNALITDYQSSGLYNISLNSNEVTIEATQSNVVFSAAVDFLAPSVSYVITNEIEDAPISFVSINKLQNDTDYCNYVKLEVTTNVLAVEVSTGSSTYPNTNNPFYIIALRGSIVNITAIDASNNNSIIQVKTPATLSSQNTNINVNNTPNGADITISMYDDYDLLLEYSLDDNIWQSANTFSSLPAGTYVLYVRDQFGCKISKLFQVTVFSPIVTSLNAYSYISPAMSIRYKKHETWDNIDIYRNDSNTLSCEELTGQSYKYIQKFKPSNLVTTQLKSNYDYIAVNIIKDDGSKQPVQLSLVKKFIDIKERMDARMYSISNNKSGIYFTSGNTYDYNTGSIIGSYALNGKLPNFGVVGNFINIPGIGWFLIEDIIYNESINADVLVISYVYFGIDSSIVIASNYNQENFNVYEFKIDFALYNNQSINIEILQSKNGYKDCNYLSEELEICMLDDNYIELIWYNIKDTDVFYNTGIKNIGNFEFLSFDADNDSSLEIHKTSTSAMIIEASNYELKVLEIDDVSTAIMLQLIQASLHKEIYVNRVKYISNSNPDIEVIPNTNLYNIKLHLLKTAQHLLVQ